MQYIQDYDEVFMFQRVNPSTLSNDGYPLLNTGLAGADAFNYKDELLPYTKNERIWICPTNIPNGALQLKPPNIGYHMNGNVILTTGLALAAVNSPASLFIMRESGRGYVFNRAYLRPIPTFCDDVVAYETGSPLTNYMPHSKGYNLPFADGHAKWYLSRRRRSWQCSRRTRTTATIATPASRTAIRRGRLSRRNITRPHGASSWGRAILFQAR